MMIDHKADCDNIRGVVVECVRVYKQSNGFFDVSKKKDVLKYRNAYSIHQDNYGGKSLQKKRSKISR
jgi:hypothetical protein